MKLISKEYKANNYKPKAKTLLSVRTLTYFMNPANIINRNEKELGDEMIGMKGSNC
jgi:hypothetical protein